MRQRRRAHLGEDHAAIQLHASKQFVIDCGGCREQVLRQPVVHLQALIEFVDDASCRAFVQLGQDEVRAREVGAPPRRLRVATRRRAAFGLDWEQAAFQAGVQSAPPPPVVASSCDRAVVGCGGDQGESRQLAHGHERDLSEYGQHFFGRRCTAQIVQPQAVLSEILQRADELPGFHLGL